jgi:hypothetical protein
MFMKVAFLVLFFAMFAAFPHAQIVHRQTTASQGTSVRMSNNVFVQQSIGQQSAIGNYLGSSFSVGQGFQQGKITQISGSSGVNIQLTAFPNPFASKLNFQFSPSVEGFIKIGIYDVMGRLVLSAEKEVMDNMMSIDNLDFADGQYIVKLSIKNSYYTINLLKMR